MDIELVAASAAITLALVFYTVGVFSERKSGLLRRSHLACFWCGLVFDTTGTALMTNMAAGGQAAGFGIHGISGMLAIALMFVHATWATWVYVRGSGRARTAFHRFSTVVWLVWLVPYVIGMLVGIPLFHLQSVCAVGTSLVVVAAIAAGLAFSSRRKGACRA